MVLLIQMASCGNDEQDCGVMNDYELRLRCG